MAAETVPGLAERPKDAVSKDPLPTTMEPDTQLDESNEEAEKEKDPSKQATAENDDICRICYDSEAPAPGDSLIAPCKCRGSMKYVHRTCLNSWRLRSRKKTSFDKCDYCGHTYAVRKTWWAPLLRTAASRLLFTAIVAFFAILSLGYLGKFFTVICQRLGLLPFWWGEPLLESLFPPFNNKKPKGLFRGLLGVDLPKDPFEPPETFNDWIAPTTSFVLGLAMFAILGVWLLVSDLTAAATFGREPIVRDRVPLGGPNNGDGGGVGRQEPGEEAGGNGGGAAGQGNGQAAPPQAQPRAGGGGGAAGRGGWLGGLAVTSSISTTFIILVLVGIFRASLVIWNLVKSHSDALLMQLDVDLLDEPYLS